MPVSPGGRPELVLPMPPPAILHRNSHDVYDRPSTPTHQAFTSPMQTPQGSPSKSRLPPGATDLPNVFDNAMKLNPPASPTRAARPQQSGFSPGKNGNDLKENGENTPPGLKFAKEGNAPAFSAPPLLPNQNQAALSRQEQYQTATSRTGTPMRGLTPEEMEKLQLPKVKRLANVTQLCESRHFTIR